MIRLLKQLAGSIGFACAPSSLRPPRHRRLPETLSAIEEITYRRAKAFVTREALKEAERFRLTPAALRQVADRIERLGQIKGYPPEARAPSA